MDPENRSSSRKGKSKSQVRSEEPDRSDALQRSISNGDLRLQKRNSQRPKSYKRNNSIQQGNAEQLMTTNCITGPDFYTNVLGPTADETILVGLETFMKFCQQYPNKYERSVPADSAAVTSSEEELEDGLTEDISDADEHSEASLVSFDRERDGEYPTTKVSATGRYGTSRSTSGRPPSRLEGALDAKGSSLRGPRSRATDFEDGSPRDQFGRSISGARGADGSRVSAMRGTDGSKMSATRGATGRRLSADRDVDGSIASAARRLDGSKLSAREAREAEEIRLSAARGPDENRLYASREGDESRLSAAREADESRLFAAREADGSRLSAARGPDGRRLPATREADESRLSAARGPDGSRLDASREADQSRLSAARGPDGRRLPATREADESRLSAAGGLDGSRLDASREADQSRLSAAKGPDGSRLDASREADQSRLSAARGPDGRRLPATREADESRLSAARGLDSSRLDASREADESRLSAARGPDGSRLYASREGDESRLSAARGPDGRRLPATREADDSRLSAARGPNGSRLYASREGDESRLSTREADDDAGRSRREATDEPTFRKTADGSIPIEEYYAKDSTGRYLAAPGAPFRDPTGRGVSGKEQGPSKARSPGKDLSRMSPSRDVSEKMVKTVIPDSRDMFERDMVARDIRERGPPGREMYDKNGSKRTVSIREFDQDGTTRLMTDSRQATKLGKIAREEAIPEELSDMLVQVSDEELLGEVSVEDEEDFRVRGPRARQAGGRVIQSETSRPSTRTSEQQSDSLSSTQESQTDGTETRDYVSQTASMQEVGTSQTSQHSLTTGSQTTSRRPGAVQYDTRKEDHFGKGKGGGKVPQGSTSPSRLKASSGTCRCCPCTQSKDITAINRPKVKINMCKCSVCKKQAQKPAVRRSCLKTNKCKCCCSTATATKSANNIPQKRQVKLHCECSDSAPNSIPSESMDESPPSQMGDTSDECSSLCYKVRYAITKITKFYSYTTFEVMRSTSKKPKVMPKSLEGVFVLKNASSKSESLAT